MQDFKRLRVWRESVELGVEIYSLTADFPAPERFGLQSQMRRTVASISSNIAEGCGRNGALDMARFLQIAIASTSELESQLILASRVGLTSEVAGTIDNVDRIRRRLINLQRRVQDEAKSTS